MFTNYKKNVKKKKTLTYDENMPMYVTGCKTATDKKTCVPLKLDKPSLYLFRKI